jgi:hypothetical protein
MNGKAKEDATNDAGIVHGGGVDQYTRLRIHTRGDTLLCVNEPLSLTKLELGLQLVEYSGVALCH